MPYQIETVDPGRTGPLVTPTEAAALLGVQRDTVWRMVRRGDLHVVRVAGAPGAHNLIRRSEVQALAEHRAARKAGR